jgi:hypothetical protein
MSVGPFISIDAHHESRAFDNCAAMRSSSARHGDEPGSAGWRSSSDLHRDGPDSPHARSTPRSLRRCVVKLRVVGHSSRQSLVGGTLCPPPLRRLTGIVCDDARQARRSSVIDSSETSSMGRASTRLSSRLIDLHHATVDVRALASRPPKPRPVGQTTILCDGAVVA